MYLYTRKWRCDQLLNWCLAFFDIHCPKPLRGALCCRRWVAWRFLAVLYSVLLAGTASADIDPWIASSLYDPRKWDTAGPYTATPWLHPPTWNPGQRWGVFSGKWRTSSAPTGSWGGLRDGLLQRYGVSLSGSYLGQFAANPSGGQEQGQSYKGDLGLALFLDLKRLMNWSGGYFTTSFSFKNAGKSLSSNYIGNQFPVQVTNGDEDGAARLVHLALGQVFWSDKAELVTGRIITGEDFATVPLACTSVNQAICGNPIAANQSISFPTYPSAVWGARFKVKPHSNWYAQAGTYLVFDGFRDADFHGLEFSAPEGSGLLTLGELGYIAGKYAQEKGPPGLYKIGGYYDGEQLQELHTGNAVRGTWGVYALAQQMLYAKNRDFTQGLSAFAAVSYAPPNRNEIAFMAAGGLSYQGLFPGRPADSLSAIGAYGRFSGDLDQAASSPESFEGLLELNYRIQLAPWVFLTPDIQYVINPGGESGIDNALVFDLSIGLTL